MPTPTQTAYLSGGCFWGMEELVRQIPGVLETEVGYTGGETPNATYEIVKAGRSGHAESLKIVFDPAKLSYRHLLFEFFRMHNPTTKNSQGNDIGAQYRSAIFYVGDEQKRTAEEVIRTVESSACSRHAAGITPSAQVSPPSRQRRNKRAYRRVTLR